MWVQVCPKLSILSIHMEFKHSFAFSSWFSWCPTQIVGQMMTLVKALHFMSLWFCPCLLLILSVYADSGCTPNTPSARLPFEANWNSRIVGNFLHHEMANVDNNPMSKIIAYGSAHDLRRNNVMRECSECDRKSPILMPHGLKNFLQFHKIIQTAVVLLEKKSIA